MMYYKHLEKFLDAFMEASRGMLGKLPERCPSFGHYLGTTDKEAERLETMAEEFSRFRELVDSASLMMKTGRGLDVSEYVNFGNVKGGDTLIIYMPEVIYGVEATSANFKALGDGLQDTLGCKVVILPFGAQAEHITEGGEG